jgi:3-methyladenine DNA glycosylase AlkD
MEKITVDKVIIKVRKANKPYWEKTMALHLIRMKDVKKGIKEILNKYGRLSKGTYQYSVKVFECGEKQKTKEKPLYTIVSTWTGTLRELETYVDEHAEKWDFVTDLFDVVKKAMIKRKNKLIKKG